jgi:hypothetical protein
VDDKPALNKNSEKAYADLSPSKIAKSLTSKPAAPATEKHLTEAKTQMTSFEKATLRWSIVAVILSLLAAFFVSGQWYEMHTSGVDTHKLAEAAKKQADIIQSEGRPYMVAEAPRFVHPPAIGQPTDATDFIRNVGKSPAIKIITNAKFLRYVNRAKSRPMVFAFLDDAFNDLKIKDTENRNEPLIRKDLAPNVPIFRTDGDQVASRADLKQIGNDDLELFYIGLVTYGDSFGGYYETEYCFFYIGNNPTIWHMCDSHNTIK